MNSQALLDHLDELIFVVDPQSYRLLYANDAARRAMSLPFAEGECCHRIFYGREEPCDDCPVCNQASRTQFRLWDREKNFCDSCYILRDKPIDWDGIPARLLVACDVTEQDFATRRVRMQLQAERMLTECIRRLTAASTIDEAVQAVLSGIGEFYEADRAYILELNCERTMGNNSYEWRAPGVSPHLQFDIDIPLTRIPFWKKAIEKEAPICLTDRNEVRESFPEACAWMEQQQVQSLMAAPFLLNNQTLGYIGVENPARNTEEASLLQAISYFIINELQKRRLNSELEYRGCHDSMTGFFNRFHYDRYLKSAGTKRLDSAGVIFCDINGLKEVNDSKGHAEGDVEIQRVAKDIRECFPDALLFRIGGDEFIIICEEIGKDLFFSLIEDAKSRFSRQSLCFVSTGAVWSAAPCDLHRMCREADGLMYQDKERYYSDEKRDRRRRR